MLCFPLCILCCVCVGKHFVEANNQQLLLPKNGSSKRKNADESKAERSKLILNSLVEEDQKSFRLGISICCVLCVLCVLLWGLFLFCILNFYFLASIVGLSNTMIFVILFDHKMQSFSIISSSVI